jgi:hypothetical protein
MKKYIFTLAWVAAAGSYAWYLRLIAGDPIPELYIAYGVVSAAGAVAVFILFLEKQNKR